MSSAASRFYKLTYFKNKKSVNGVINLYAIAQIECCENVVRIMFQISPPSVLIKPTHCLELTFPTEKDSTELYNEIENAMNPINKQSDVAKKLV